MYYITMTGDQCKTYRADYNTDRHELRELLDIAETWESEDKDGTKYWLVDDDTGETITTDYVVDEDGKLLYFDAAAMYMDDDIREDLHLKMAPCTRQEFFDAYCKRHKKRFHEKFWYN